MSRCVSDGVVLIDPEYLKERKGEIPEQNQCPDWSAAGRWR